MELNGVMVPLQDVLEPSRGYIIRPFVGLRSQRDGFMWKKGDRRGFWREFMDSETGKFTLLTTGLKIRENY